MRIKYYRLLVFFLLLSSSLFSMEQCTGVLEPTAEELKALQTLFREYTPGQTRGELPPSVMNLEHLPKVSTQGSLGICGSFCVYYYLSTYCNHKAKGLSGRPSVESNPEHIFSPAWGVLTAPHGAFKYPNRDVIPDGAATWKSIITIVEQGNLTWRQMPYDTPVNFYKTYPGVEQQTAALLNRAAYGVMLKDCNTPEGFERLKHFLHDGNIAVVSWTSPLTTNFDSYPAPSEYVNVEGRAIGNINSNVYAWPSAAPGRDPGHAVTIIGYDDNIPYTNKEGVECKGALLAVSSWGTDWGVSPKAGVEAGFIWISYETMHKYGKLGNAAFSMVFPEQQPAMEDILPGTLRLQDMTGQWATTMFTNVKWLNALKLEWNSGSLERGIFKNEYVVNTNTGSSDLLDFVLDLTQLREHPLP